MKQPKIHQLSTAGATDGQVPTVNTTTNALEFKDLPGLTIQDEDATIATGITKLDFQGAGVTASPGVAGEVILSIPGGGGGGSAAQSYVGRNVVGVSWETFTQNRVYMKQITLATAALLTDIEAYIDQGAAPGKVDSFAVALFADNAGAPGSILQANQLRATGLLAQVTTSTPGRWFGLAVGRWLAAGSYWLGVGILNDTDVGSRLAYDTGGTDRYYTAGGGWLSDGGWSAVTTSPNTYSIRGNIVTL